jgi:hypothetical protein
MAAFMKDHGVWLLVFPLVWLIFSLKQEGDARQNFVLLVIGWALAFALLGCALWLTIATLA